MNLNLCIKLLIVFSLIFFGVSLQLLHFNIFYVPEEMILLHPVMITSPTDHIWNAKSGKLIRGCDDSITFLTVEFRVALFNLLWNLFCFKLCENFD